MKIKKIQKLFYLKWNKQININKKKFIYIILYYYTDLSLSTAYILNIINNKNSNHKIAFILFLSGNKINTFKFINAEKTYIKNKIISFGEHCTLIEGNTLPLKKVEKGMKVFNIQLNLKENYFKLIKSGGCYGTLLYKKNLTVVLELPSTLKIEINNNNYCTLGTSFLNKYNLLYKRFNKFGAYKILFNIFPTVRGTAKNAVDHPHGGGKGKTSIGKKTQFLNKNIKKGFKTTKYKK